MSYKVAFIGTGGRSECYARAYRDCDDVEIVALVDPLEKHRQVFCSNTDITCPTQYDRWEDLYDNHTDLDGLVVCSPNHLHAEHAVPFLERGLSIALEKPLATTPDDCRAILRAQRTGGGKTLLGFVLRSSPFYSTVYSLIGEGAIGRVVSIQADELPGIGVSSIMNRSPWRRYTQSSGGSMLEKSCHDMDLLSWLTGSRPTWLNSCGGTHIFGPNPSVADRCDACGVTDTCAYSKTPTPEQLQESGGTGKAGYYREDDVCIYNADKDVIDNQSVQIEFENGCLVNFMLTFNCMGQQASRNIHAVGTRGRVWGNLHDAKVYHHDNATDRTRSIDCSGDGSGHGGGDRVHALELVRMMAQADYHPEQDAAAGYLSAMMSFATDISRTEARRVYFRYRGRDHIDLV